MDQDIIIEQMKLDMQPLSTDKYIYKSYNLIESGYVFTVNEQRLTYLASKKLKPIYIKSNIKPSQLTTLLGHQIFKDIKIYVNEFKEAFNLNSNNLYKVLEDTAENLFNKKIQYLQDDGTFVEKRWVITSKYNQDEKYVELTFHPDLILDLLILKGRYGKLEYDAVAKFKTFYSFRIHELLQNYAYKGRRTVELQELRYKLGIYDDTKYTKYSEFKRNVLTPAVKAINEYTNLNVSFTESRKGRKIATIHFNISQKTTQLETQEPVDDTIDLFQVQKMSSITGLELSAGEVAILTDTAIESIRKYKIDMAFYEYIQYEVDRVKEYSQITTVKNYFGCLKTALQEYWKEHTQIHNPSGFNNFQPTNYDWDKLEEGLHGWKEYNMEDCIK